MTLVLLFALTANALTFLAESYSGCRFLPATARTDRDCGPLPPKSGRVSTSAPTHIPSVPSACTVPPRRSPSSHCACHVLLTVLWLFPD